MKLNEIIDRLPNHDFLKVSIDTSIPDLTELVRENRGVRSIYVEDRDKRIVGEISLGSLVKVVTGKRQCATRLSTRDLLSCITCRTARDIMDKKLISASLDEDVEEVIMKFIRNDIKEMPVLDQDGRIIKNIGVLDLWAIAESR